MFIGAKNSLLKYPLRIMVLMKFRRLQQAPGLSVGLLASTQATDLSNPDLCSAGRVSGSSASGRTAKAGTLSTRMLSWMSVDLSTHAKTGNRLRLMPSLKV
jgi:hypothetical protein